MAEIRTIKDSSKRKRKNRVLSLKEYTSDIIRRAQAMPGSELVPLLSKLWLWSMLLKPSSLLPFSHHKMIMTVVLVVKMSGD